MLALTCNVVFAASLGGLATSIGFAGLALGLVGTTWLAAFSAAGWPTITGALLLGGGAAWVWRARASHFTGTSTTPFGPARDTGPSRIFVEPFSPAFAPVQLLKELRVHFVMLQTAWDGGETESLRTLTTPDMLREFRQHAQECGWVSGGQRSEVVLLRANLLGLEDSKDSTVVTVEFSGLMREAPELGADPFHELWMLTKSKQGAETWRLARHQALL